MDVVLDPTGAASWTASMGALARGGRDVGLRHGSFTLDVGLTLNDSCVIAHGVDGINWVGVWATVMGLAFGALFQLTGSLMGPIAAHALINGVNLTYLRAHDPGQRRLLG